MSNFGSSPSGDKIYLIVAALACQVKRFMVRQWMLVSSTEGVFSVMVKDAFLLVFCEENSASIVAATGRSVQDGRILEKDGTRTQCHFCSREMTVEHLGRVLPGSTILCCDDPTCFNSFSVDLV